MKDAFFCHLAMMTASAAASEIMSFPASVDSLLLWTIIIITIYVTIHNENLMNNILVSLEIEMSKTNERLYFGHGSGIYFHLKTIL